jgi:hypothetical protein
VFLLAPEITTDPRFRDTQSCPTTFQSDNSKKLHFEIYSRQQVWTVSICLARPSYTNPADAFPRKMYAVCPSFEAQVTLFQALDHPYFHALPYPSHPSKLPKPAKPLSKPLDELDGNVEQNSIGPGVKAAPPNRLKRKLSSVDEPNGRGIGRKLDFTSRNNSP